VPLAGAKFVFAVNAACFLVVVLATRQWKQPTVLEKLPFGELFSFFLDGHPLRAFCAEVPGRIGPKFPICSVHFSDSGADASHGLESVALQFV